MKHTVPCGSFHLGKKGDFAQGCEQVLQWTDEWKALEHLKDGGEVIEA